MRKSYVVFGQISTVRKELKWDGGTDLFKKPGGDESEGQRCGHNYSPESQL